jgi:HSP20 family molecular chaperone IbpA
MARYISDKEIHVMAEDLIYDAAIYYLNDFEMPRRTKNGECIFETYKTPAFRIHPTEEAIVISACIDGYERNEVTVTVEDAVLTIAGRHAIDEPEKDGQQKYGTFYREIYIPRTIDPDAISATYQDAVLRITLPKKKKKALRVLKIE